MENEIQNLRDSIDILNNELSRQKIEMETKLKDFYDNKKKILEQYLSDVNILQETYDKISTDFLKDELLTMIDCIKELSKKISNEKGVFRPSEYLDDIKIGKFSVSIDEKPFKEYSIQLKTPIEKIIGNKNEFFTILNGNQIFELKDNKVILTTKDRIDDLSITFDKMISYCQFSKEKIKIFILNENNYAVEDNFEINFQHFTADYATFSVLKDTILIHDKSQVLMFNKETIELFFCWTYGENRSGEISNRINENTCYQYFNQTGLIFESFNEINSEFSLVKVADRVTDYKLNNKSWNMASDCAICMESLNDKDVRQLPCHSSHLFCYQCLFKYAESNRIRFGDSLPCPICKTEIVWPKNGVESLKRVFLRRSLSESDFGSMLANERRKTLQERKKNFDLLEEQTNYLIKKLLDKKACIEQQLNRFYDEKIENLERLEKEAEELNNTQLIDLPNLGKLSKEDRERDLNISIKDILRQKISVEKRNSHSELCKVTYSKEEEPAFQYGLVQQGPHYIIGGNYCFFLQTVSGFYECSNSNALLYDAINFSSANISNDSSLFTFTQDETALLHSQICKWDKNTKLFYKYPTTGASIDEIDWDDFVYFRHKNDIIIYDIRSAKLVRQPLYDQFKNSCHTKFKNGTWFILKNGYDFRYYPMKNLITTRNYQGHNVLIQIQDGKISIRQDIINELRNGKILFSNEKYVFLLDENLKSAKAYLQKNLFREGQLKAHFQSLTEIHFYNLPRTFAMECSICLENLCSSKETKRLPCYWSHVFCTTCLKDIIERKDIGGYFSCPICQHPIKYPEGGIETFRSIDTKKTCMENYKDEINRETERLNLKRKADIDELNKHVKCLKQSIDNDETRISYKICNFYNGMKESYRQIAENITDYLKSEALYTNSVQNRKLITFKETIISSVDNNISKNIVLNFSEPRLNYVKLQFQHEEKPVKEYFREMPESFRIFGGDNCFLVVYDRQIFEWNSNEYIRHAGGVEFTDGAINSNKEFYVYKTLPQNREERGTVVQWCYKDKSFQSIYNKRNEEEVKINGKKFLVFTNQTSLVLFDLQTGQLINIDLHYDLSCWKTKYISHGDIYFLRDSINLQYFPISKLIDDKILPGNNILINIHHEQISIRNDIIEEIVMNERVLLSNEQFVFILNENNKSAIAYPQRNVFQEGQIISYFVTDNDIHFCILCESLAGKHCLIKSYLLKV
ncbi:DgyrCDS3676 [Dimorphilus gyrociliatus]|uniref:DgyrCDS3676 n=1 Tax=Dimorphilus gyrociliatus TaxID=2664684 RepID=A0A7I8VH25_9ANNE|nr:DgyrCDS3676 [Dimorphilus gyrociliatus]